MSLGRGVLVSGAFAVLLCPSLAQAQDDGTKPPFYEADRESKEDKKKTGFSGNVTSSSFYFTESARASAAIGEAEPLENASVTDRVFTDLRLQLAADHIKGGNLDFKLDFRGRKQLDRCDGRIRAATEVPVLPPTTCEAAQSGTFGGDELHLREAHLTYRGRDYDMSLGRQVVPEVASVRFDGVRVEQHKGKSWKYMGFAGLYPRRGSRDLRADYAKVPSDVMDPASAKSRLLPVVAGASGSYRRERIYGSIGVAGILPRGNEIATGLAESDRFFVTSNGYWQQSDKTDIYHFIVLDVAGNQGASISNFSVGASHRPTTATRLFARINRVDTETLNVNAQQRLVPVDPAASAAIQNNWYVSRVAQESGELGGTASFRQNRFALSASGTLRRRPEITLVQTNEDLLVLEMAQALDIRLQLVDRHSYKDFRVGASVTRSSGFGDDNLDRSQSTLGSLELSRDLAGGKGEFEINVNYLNSADQSQALSCGIGQADFLECFGTSESTSYSAGGVVFYRPKRNWFAMGMANVASQKLTTANAAEVKEPQPSVLMLTAFLRLGYRF
mgnify:CR=1 FL=1|tara:strand:+ start:31270 stop:32949 length:1680 start_codon:yes stop_codon:yes gene_type:complete